MSKASKHAANAHALREAMKGFGTDEATLVRVIGALEPQDIKPLIETYSKEINRDLLNDIKSETSGNFEDLLVALLTPTIEYDAAQLRKAMKGIGTDEEVLIEIIGTRAPAELEQITAAFKYLYEHDLEADVRSETSGDFKKALCSRLKNKDEAQPDINRDVDVLYKAGQGRIGTDEAVFVSILSTRSKQYMAQLNVAYANKHGKSLASVVESECSGDFRRSLLALVTPPAEYLADKLYKAMKGMGTDDKCLIRIVASQRGRLLKEIGQVFLNKYQKSLKKMVEDDTSGDYKKLLVRVLEHYIEGK